MLRALLAWLWALFVRTDPPTSLSDLWAALAHAHADAPGSAPMPWAFFTLKSGVPGSGKSLTLVAELQEACNGENPPTVYVHNIPNLALPHIPLPVFNPVVTVKGDDGKPMQVFSRTLEVDWSSVASGSLVVIDEAQHVFPPRGSAGRVPGYVSFLNTHRHKPVLIVLITQHPKLIDGAVRKLISKHQHYRRVFGGGRHICYEWDSCSENLAGFKEATKRVAAFPKKAYAAYKSAEAHHKPKFRLPFWFAIPLIAIAGFAYFFPDVYRIFTGQYGKAAADRAAAAAGVASSPGAPIPPGRPGQRAAPGDSRRFDSPPPVPALPMPATYRPAEFWPVDVAGCFITSTECVCALQSGRLARDMGQMCYDIATRQLDVHPTRPRPVGRSDNPGAQASVAPPGQALPPAASASQAAGAAGGGQRPAQAETAAGVARSLPG